MQGLFLVAALSLLFLALGLNVRSETGPVRLFMLGAIVVLTGWYLLF
jgi:hypothetical protein